jgi:hypothetical protein
MCQGSIQFNGSHGCSWCLAQGESYRDALGKRRWIYPPTPNLELRTKDQFLNHLSEYSEILGNGSSASSHFGIKEASPLLIPKFDIVDGLVFDYMHTVFLGAVRTVTNLWLNPNYHGEDFYIGRKTVQINESLAKVAVPDTLVVL